MILRAPSAEHHSLQGCTSWFTRRLRSRPARPGGGAAQPGYGGAPGPVVACRRQLAFGGTAREPRGQTLPSPVERGAALFSLEQ